ncbi:aminoglycoside N(3)-acetyltransferase [Chitinophaga qingshengii]|uniref:Aminoglycoside N(3)-acetyltransferase n=1 Tax=Chitinophaga qingshengii TaxID=1569794 RepID=A0ABR7TW24_9BACT|nr:AAC(3) family N-acetyltransferase [Chitinophaga qingshengii]MBC9933865.1 AAC(3) family N-acetyltransferase [Chitinophaga qingshengii]
MSEENLINRTTKPVTAEALFDQLKSLGIQSGDTLLVHSSLSSLGWVNGGPVAVIQALLQAVGEEGTIVMPAQSASITNPENWQAPAVPKDWVDTIRYTMPAYDPRITPTRDMGQIAELFRTWPGAVRSDHPFSSFAALGPLSEQIISHHPLHDPLGMSSPLGKLYQLPAKVLLIGVDFDKCTALHLAEQIVWPGRRKTMEGAPLMVHGKKQWVSFQVPQVMDSAVFLPVGAAVLASGMAASGTLGEGKGVLVGLRQLVDTAVKEWSGMKDPVES